MANAILSIVISARDVASAAIERVQGAVAKSSEATLKAIRNISVAMTGLGIAGTLASKKLSDEFLNLDQASDALLVALKGNTDAHAELTAKARELASTLPIAGGEFEATAGLAKILRSGLFEVSEASDVLATAVRLAETTGSDLSTAIDAITTAVGAYGPEVLSATDAGDRLLATFRNQKGSLEDLSSGLSSILPLAAQLKIPIEDVGAAVAFLGSKGVDSSQAMTVLGTFLAKTLEPTDEMKARFEELGVSTFPELVEKSEGLAGAMRSLVGPMAEDSAAIADLFGDARSLKVILPLLTADEGELNRVQWELNDSTGVLGETFDQVANDAAASLTTSSNRIRSAMARIGESTTPAMVAMKEWQAKLAEGFADLNDRTGGAIGAILSFGSQAAATVGPIVAMTAQLALLTKGKLLATIASHGLKAAMIAIPIFLLIAAIALLITHWDEVKAALERVWSFLVSTFSPAFEVLKAVMTTVFEAVGAVVRFFSTDAVKALSLLFPPLLLLQLGPEKIMEAFRPLVDFFRDLWNRIVEGFKKLVEFGLNLGKWFFENVVKGVWNFLTGLPAAAIRIVSKFVNGFVDAFKGIFGRVFDLGVQFVKSIIRGILSFLGPLGDTIRPVLEAVLGPLTGSPWLKPEIADRFFRVGSDMSTAIAAGITDGAAAAERAVGRAVGGLQAVTGSSSANGRNGIGQQINFARGAITIQANSAAEGREAAKGFMNELRRRGIRVAIGVS